MKRILLVISFLVTLLSCKDYSTNAENDSEKNKVYLYDGLGYEIGVHVYVGKIHYIKFNGAAVVNYTQDSIDHEEYLKYESDSTLSVMDHNPMDYLLVHKKLCDRDAREFYKSEEVSYP